MREARISDVEVMSTFLMSVELYAHFDYVKLNIVQLTYNIRFERLKVRIH